MSLFSRPRATVLQRTQSTSQSDNSHSSDSGASHPSGISSNTSWATHYPPNVLSAPNPLPKGAGAPQVNPPVLHNDVLVVSSPGPSPNARKSRVLRKSPPPVSDADGMPVRSGRRKWISFRSPSRGPSSRSPSRVRINLDDDAPLVAPGATRHVSLPPPPKSSLLHAPSSHRLPRRSRSPGRNRSQSPSRARSLNGHAVHVSEPGPHPPDVLDRLRAELARIEDDRPMGAWARDTGPQRSATAKAKSIVHRNKPLPTPPGLAHGSSGHLAVPVPTSIGVTGRPIMFRHSSYMAASEEEEEEAESRFGHFNSGQHANRSGHAYEHAHTPRTSMSDLGHAYGGHSRRASWSDLGHGSGYATPVWDEAHSEAHYQASEPHYQQNREPSNYPYHTSFAPMYSPPPTDARRASSSLTALHANHAPSARSTLTFAPSTRSAPMYLSRSSYRDQQPPAASSTLSLGKRIKRTFSLSLSRKVSEAERTPSAPPHVQNWDGSQSRRSGLAYSYSDSGHGSSFAGPVSTLPAFMPWSQYPGDEPHSREQPRPPRKLRKRAPSVANSLASTAASTSTPGLLESQFALAPHAYSEPNADSNPGRRRSKSSPPRRARASTPPPVPPLPPAFSPTPSTSAPDSQAQSPSVSPTRKLTKRAPKRKKTQNAGDHSDVTLPPLRAVSPIDLDLITPSFSQASRSQSVPNLGPLAPAFQYRSEQETPPSQFLTFLTESPPSSPLSSQPHGPSGSASHQGHSSSTPDRPSFLRSQSNRRWTLAVSEVPDEQLVEELERLRSVGWGLGFQGELVRVRAAGDRGVDGEGAGDEGAKWAKVDDAGWLVARRALMVCRELVRTERNYRAGLISLQRGETRKAPPPLLLQYLPALISASQAFIARLDEDPSAWGVSAAFLGMEDTIEAALVAWSGVVGEFFTTNKGKQRRQWSTNTGDKDKEKKEKEKEKEKKVVTGAPVLPPVGSSEDEHPVQPVYPAAKSAPSTWRTSMPALSQLLTSTSEVPPHENRKQRQSTGSHASSGATKTPTVQDLAIQPTQRVMRYVLLYKDLLNCTPIASPARPLVERALEGATRIAQRCNRAQDNAAFLT